MKTQPYERRLKREFGITIDEYNALFEKQSGRCAICGRHQSELKRRLAVDHNHIDGKVRALLCTYCNTGLGSFFEDIELIEKAKEYLISHG